MGGWVGEEGADGLTRRGHACFFFVVVRISSGFSWCLFVSLFLSCDGVLVCPCANADWIVPTMPFLNSVVCVWVGVCARAENR